jgi:FKBP-type peptidyl-prolyl cis-trans isomerase 2
MKKSLLLSLILLSWILLTACGKNDEENITDTTMDAVVTDCQKAVQKYLDGADKQWQWDEVKSGDNIVVDYIWRLDDWTVFDTSIQSIAESCGIYSEGRDYTEGLSFQAWAGQMVKWFDNGVIWMKVGQTKTVEFWPEEWYGEYDENLVVTASIDEVGDVSQFKEWDTVYLWMWYPAKIVKITDKEVTFDMNSELAGKSLIFDITLKSIN